MPTISKDCSWSRLLEGTGSGRAIAYDPKQAQLKTHDTFCRDCAAVFKALRQSLTAPEPATTAAVTTSLPAEAAADAPQVALLCRDLYHFALAFNACLYAGCIPVLSGDKTLPQLQSSPSFHQFAAVFTDSTPEPGAEDSGSAAAGPDYLEPITTPLILTVDTILSADNSGTATAAGTADSSAAAAAAEARALFREHSIKGREESLVIHFLTSGSTGTPKTVVKSLELMERESALIAAESVFVRHEPHWNLLVSSVYATHLYGLTFALFYPLLQGKVFSRTPVRFSEELHHYTRPLPVIKTQEHLDTAAVPASAPEPQSPRVMLVSSPTFIRNLDPVINQKRLMSTEVTISAGGVLDLTTVASYQLSSVIDIYGSTETGVIAWNERQRDRDFAGNRLFTGVKAFCRIFSDGTSRSFLQHPLLTQNHHQVSNPGLALDDVLEFGLAAHDLEWSPAPCLPLQRVGLYELFAGQPRYNRDLDCFEGMVSAGLAFTVNGRCDDIIKAGEQRISLGGVARMLHSLPEIADCAVIDYHKGTRTFLGALVVLNPHIPFPTTAKARLELKQRWQARLKNYLSGPAFPRAFVFLPQLPVNSMGKQIRSELRQLLLSELEHRHQSPTAAAAADAAASTASVPAAIAPAVPAAPDLPTATTGTLAQADTREQARSAPALEAAAVPTPAQELTTLKQQLLQSEFARMKQRLQVTAADSQAQNGTESQNCSVIAPPFISFQSQAQSELLYFPDDMVFEYPEQEQDEAAGRPFPAQVVMSCSLSSKLLWFTGHFIDYPILPGIAQLTLLRHTIEQASHHRLTLGNISQVKFTRPLHAGEQLYLNLKLLPTRARPAATAAATMTASAAVAAAAAAKTTAPAKISISFDFCCNKNQELLPCSAGKCELTAREHSA